LSEKFSANKLIGVNPNCKVTGEQDCNQPVKHRNFFGAEMRGTPPSGTGSGEKPPQSIYSHQSRAASIEGATTIIAFGQNDRFSGIPAEREIFQSAPPAGISLSRSTGGQDHSLRSLTGA
jgi:hypothetical protein